VHLTGVSLRSTPSGDFFVGLCGNSKYQGLELRVSIEANVEILSGLGAWAFAIIVFITEVLMNSSIVNSCVWCGVAFLRGHGGTLPIQMRD
jgi:hypothetical protein